MESAEPIEPRFVHDPTHPPAGEDEAWRAEVALRVHSYRARHKRKGSENAPALDFGPAIEEPCFDSRSPAFPEPGPASYAAQNRVMEKGNEPRIPARPARNAIDTNYYRRLNAASISQSSNVTMGATAAASVPVHEFAGEDEPEGSIAASAKLRDEPCGELALDLEIRPAVAGDSCLDRYRIADAEAVDAEAAPEKASRNALITPRLSPPASTAQGNLIVFRRPFLEPPLAPQPSRDELAEPMNRRPRILEVPEDIMPAVQGSLFPEIRLDADEQETSHPREPEIKVPLRVARVSERLAASLADLGVVMSAGLLFAGMAWRALPEIPHTKPFFMMLGGVTLLLWAVYQYLFLLYAGRTPGMSLRGIRLRTFDGRAPEWEQRARRARFMFISFASVSLGFLWALVDEDTLCWHDRLSQTFPTNE